MSLQAFQEEIEQAARDLLALARDMTWNKLPDNCRFILTEIKESRDSFHERRRKRNVENDAKMPVTLQAIMPALEKFYHDFYDINLYVCKVTAEIAVMEIQYYLKSSLDDNYRQKIVDNPPMLHCKVAVPFWLSDSKEKFDINWEHTIE